MKIRPATLEKYERFFALGKSATRRLERIELAHDGIPALEAFHAYESTGELPPTFQPQYLEQYLTGKEVHGITVAMVAEDFAVNRTIFSDEIKLEYPKWVADEIFQQARKIALKQIGFVPTFIRAACDFSESTCKSSAANGISG